MTSYPPPDRFYIKKKGADFAAPFDYFAKTEKINSPLFLYPAFPFVFGIGNHDFPERTDMIHLFTGEYCRQSAVRKTGNARPSIPAE